MPITLPKMCERSIVIDDMTFVVGPESIDDLAASVSFVRRNELDQGSSRWFGSCYELIRRIRSWDGIVDQDGNPAPCTNEVKLFFAAHRTDLMSRIAEELARQEAADLGN